MGGQVRIDLYWHWAATIHKPLAICQGGSYAASLRLSDYLARNDVRHLVNSARSNEGWGC